MVLCGVVLWCVVCGVAQLTVERRVVVIACVPVPVVRLQSHTPLPVWRWVGEESAFGNPEFLIFECSEFAVMATRVGLTIWEFAAFFAEGVRTMSSSASTAPQTATTYGS